MTGLIKECCVCREHYDYKEKKWYYPSVKERRDNFVNGAKYTHGFCDPCYALNCKMLGIDPNEEVVEIHLKHEEKSKTK